MWLWDFGISSPPLRGERTQVRERERFMGSLHTVFAGHWGHEPLDVRFVVERFSAVVVPLRHAASSR